MDDIVKRLRITHFMDGHELGMTEQRAEAADEIERLRGLLREVVNSFPNRDVSSEIQELTFVPFSWLAEASSAIGDVA